jgi:hypothetical protein
MLQGYKTGREEIRDEDVGSVIFPRDEIYARAKFTNRRTAYKTPLYVTNDVLC